MYVDREAERTASLTQLLQAYPQQLITGQSFANHFLVLNATVAPFDNPLARQAVAQALTADPTLVGHRRWNGVLHDRAARFSRPAQLVRVHREPRSGRRRLSWPPAPQGATVHVYFINAAPFAQIGAYVTEVLNEIGYHATLTLQDDYQADVYNPQTRPVNVEGEEWIPDFPTESQFWLVASCDPAAFLTQLGTCNPQVDALAKTALAAQQNDPSAAQTDWQHAYALMDSDARLIPLDTPPDVDVLVSPRVGNVEITPSSALEALLDQFWVR